MRAPGRAGFEADVDYRGSSLSLLPGRLLKRNSGVEGGNEAASFLVSLISALLPELNFGRSARFTELFAFPLGLKKKRKKKRRPSPYRSMCRGREKPLFIKLPRVHLSHDLYGHILSSGQPKHTRNSTLVSSGRAGLCGIYQALALKHRVLF